MWEEGGTGERKRRDKVALRPRYTRTTQRGSHVLLSTTPFMSLFCFLSLAFSFSFKEGGVFTLGLKSLLNNPAGHTSQLESFLSHAPHPRHTTSPHSLVFSPGQCISTIPCTRDGSPFNLHLLRSCPGEQMQPHGSDKDHIMIRYVRLIFTSSGESRQREAASLFCMGTCEKNVIGIFFFFFLSEWAPRERLGVVKVRRREWSVPQPS